MCIGLIGLTPSDKFLKLSVRLLELSLLQVEYVPKRLVLVLYCYYTFISFKVTSVICLINY